MPPPLLFRGTMALHVTRAPEPGSIIWENLELPSWERRLRRLVSSFVLMLVLFITIAVTAASQARHVWTCEDGACAPLAARAAQITRGFRCLLAAEPSVLMGGRSGSSINT